MKSWVDLVNELNIIDDYVSYDDYVYFDELEHSLRLHLTSLISSFKTNNTHVQLGLMFYNDIKIIRSFLDEIINRNKLDKEIIDLCVVILNTKNDLKMLQLFKIFFQEINENESNF